MEELNTDGLRDDVVSAVRPFFDSLLNDEKDNIAAIYLTGSALTDDYRPKYSDINSLIVVKGISPGLLDYLADAGKKYGKKGIKAPLIMTPVYIAHSLDVFPIEFLELKTIHHLVFGENQLENLNIQKSNLRLQC